MVFGRQAGERADHRARQRYAEVRDHVGVATVGKAVDDLGADLTYGGFERADLGGAHHRGEDLAYARVLRRVGLAEVELIVGAGVDVERDESSLLEGRRRSAHVDDVTVTRQVEHARDHLFDRAFVTESGKGRQMIVDGSWVERVVVDGHVISLTSCQTRAALSQTIMSSLGVGELHRTACRLLHENWAT